MATLAQAYLPKLARIAITRKRDEFIEKLIPRPCMVLSGGLVLAGLSIPMLMAIQLLQPGFFLGFLGFALVATGGTLMLIFCGEI